MAAQSFRKLCDYVFSGGSISEKDAAGVLGIFERRIDIHEIIAGVNRIRLKYKTGAVHFCSIINAKSGFCPEDCAYCSQSALSRAQIETYPFIGGCKISNGYAEASKRGFNGYSIVTSGNNLNKREINEIAAAIRKSAKKNTPWCVSLGALTKEQLTTLKNAGVKRVHHNLETSKSYFSKVCSTHTYGERVETIKLAKKVGFEVCSGGLFGLGESWRDRLELALELKKLGVDSVPVNFLNPIAGTKLEQAGLLEPVEALKIIALIRLVLPKADVIICGGRQKVLRDLHPLVFFAGANGIMTGDYLTTQGRDYESDKQMVKDLTQILQ